MSLMPEFMCISQWSQVVEKRTAFPRERRTPSRHTGLPSVHLVQSDRVKPVSTRLPRLVARGCPAAALGHFVRDTCLRRIHPDDKPCSGSRGLWGTVPAGWGLAWGRTSFAVDGSRESGYLG